MPEPADPAPLPQATIVPPKRGRISVVWIIPILAAAVAIGIAVQRILSEGPTITIVFTAAEGIEAGKTFIKYKDVNIGQVTAVRLTNDYTKVEVTAKIDQHAAGLMVQDAKFWVVRPQITLSGISGLSTLLSGNYIGFAPGTAERRATHFIGLDVAPVVAGQAGRAFVLNSSDLGSLNVGSPVYYRRLPVGEVTGYDLEASGRAVQIKIFIRAPYDRYVVSGTRFWNASGMDLSLGADGLSVRTESVVAMLIGGIAFDIPPFMTPGTAAAAQATFTLYNDRTTAMKAPDPVAKRYMLVFNESVRGLAVGAPVTFLGLTAGEVTDIGLDVDLKTANLRPRVEIVFYPERLLAFERRKTDAPGDAATPLDEQERQAVIRRLVEQRGLRAQLRTGSLITGQLYVAFDYFPDAPKVKLDLSKQTPEAPTVPSVLANLEAKVTAILDRIDKMPLDAIGNDLKADLANLDQTLTSARKLITNADEQVVPGLKASMETLNKTLVAVERAANNADATLLQSSAPAQEELRAALREFAGAARSVRILMNELERQPSSVIRGKPEPLSGGR
jgi:paraquat-inducible protein B